MNTIDLGENPSAQTVFDTVVTHLRGLPHQAVNEKYHCLYETPDGLRCAIGIFLSGDILKFDDGVESLMDSRSEDVPVWFTNHFDLLHDLQEIHDSPMNWRDGRREQGIFNERGEDNFRSLASEQALVYTSRAA